MLEQKKNKETVWVMALIVCLLTLIVFGLFTSEYSSALKADKEAMEQIEYISANVERIGYLELERVSNDHIIETVDDSILLLNYQDKYHNDIYIVFQEFIEQWQDFKQTIMNYRENDDKELFFQESESYYENTQGIILEIYRYIDKWNIIVNVLTSITTINVILIIIILIRLLNFRIFELQKNKEFAKEMDIDLITGIYDIKRCQEMLDTPAKFSNHTERAIVIFDINDLKATNMEFGRESGDVLIATFADMLKKAIKVSPYETFFGRCGNDEFMVYFPVAEEMDIINYVEEMKFLCKQFNTSEDSAFKMNFSVGYAITSPKIKLFTNRQLYDIAIEYLLEHKEAMKEVLKKEMED